MFLLVICDSLFLLSVLNSFHLFPDFGFAISLNNYISIVSSMGACPCVNEHCFFLCQTCPALDKCELFFFTLYILQRENILYGNL